MAIDKPKLIGIDTNIFIYYFQGNNSVGANAKRIFEGLISAKIKAVTSIITLMELLSLPSSKTNIEILKNHFLETPNLTIQDINQSIALEAARIRRVYKFSIPDAIQLATCLFHKADLFMTNDKKIKSFKELTVIIISQKPNLNL